MTLRRALLRFRPARFRAPPQRGSSCCFAIMREAYAGGLTWTTAIQEGWRSKSDVRLFKWSPASSRISLRFSAKPGGVRFDARNAARSAQSRRILKGRTSASGRAPRTRSPSRAGPPSRTTSGAPQRCPVLRDAVHVHHAVLRHGRNAGARGENADQIQRIARAQRSALFARLRNLPHGAHRVHRLRQRELLARESLRESTSPELTPRLQPAIDLQQLPPGRTPRLARQQVAEDDAIPAQVLPRQLLQPFRFPLLRLVRSEQRPAPRRGVGLSLEESAEGREPVAGQPPAGHQLPERSVQIASGESGLRAELVQEKGAALLEQRQEQPRPVTQRFARAAGRV